MVQRDVFPPVEHWDRTKIWHGRNSTQAPKKSALAETTYCDAAIRVPRTITWSQLVEVLGLVVCTYRCIHTPLCPSIAPPPYRCIYTLLCPSIAPPPYRYIYTFLCPSIAPPPYRCIYTLLCPSISPPLAKLYSMLPFRIQYHRSVDGAVDT